jgi:hypothetical protein
MEVKVSLGIGLIDIDGKYCPYLSTHRRSQHYLEKLINPLVDNLPSIK